MFDFEEVVWGYVTLIVAFIEIIVTIRYLLAKPTPLNSLLGFLIISLNTFGIYLLILILGGEWPSYLPHVAILIATIVLLVQRSLMK